MVLVWCFVVLGVQWGVVGEAILVGRRWVIVISDS